MRAARPLFCRSSFHDSDEADDVLELAAAVDRVLTEASARGRKAPLVFLDTRRFPGAYRLTGSYTTKDGATKVRYRLRRDKETVSDWAEIEAPAAALPARMLKAALKHLPGK